MRERLDPTRGIYQIDQWILRDLNPSCDLPSYARLPPGDGGFHVASGTNLTHRV